MTKIIEFIFWVTSICLLAGCGGRNTGEFRDGKIAAEPQLNEVEVITLERKDFARQLVSNGKLRASRRASLSFGTSGTVVELCAGNGSRVGRGDVIARLDRPDLKLLMDAALISHKSAELDLYDILAGQGYPLRDTANVPPEILATAKMRSGYAASVNTLERAKLDYEHSVLKAPFSGRIADLNSKEYDLLGTDAFCTVIDDGTLDVDFYVMESEYYSLSTGLKVKVEPFSNPGKIFSGRIREINPSVNKNGQIMVRASIPNDGSLIDGMNVKVVVEYITPEQLVVPRNAVVIRDNLDVLFTYTDDGFAHWTYVNILQSNGDYHAVTANTGRNAILSEGDKVIVSGNLNLADGSKVQLKK